MRRRNKGSKPRFNLDGNKDSKEQQIIYLVFRYQRDGDEKKKRLKYSTGEKTYRKTWNEEMQRVKHSVHLDGDRVDAINDKLNLLEKRVKEIYANNRNISISDFKRELDYDMGVLIRPKSKYDYTLLEYARSFIDRSTNHERTIQKYETAYNHLTEFEKFLGSPITFDQINAEFAEKFKAWLYRNTNVKSQNTAAKLIQNLREFVNDAYENGYHQNILFKSRKFGISRVQTSKHFLEWNELEVLRQSDHLLTKALIRVKDLWLIAAYSGLRYSDFSRLNPDDFISDSGVKMIQLDTYKGRTTKPDTEVVIPILPELDKLLSKYNYQPPNALSSQKMNEYIKNICALVGISREVTHKTSNKGKIISVKVPIHQHITNHAARYTFINIMINEFGISPVEMTKITGQSLKVLMGYVRGDKVKNASKVHSKLIETMKNRRDLKVI